MTQKTVAQTRNYRVENVKQAREIALSIVKLYELENAITFGLPEIDDRYRIWRVPLRKKGTKNNIGEVVIDAKSSLIDNQRTTQKEILETSTLSVLS